MIDKILLFPYYLTLKTRHFLYDHGIRKVRRSEISSIGIGNITVGGTGKTPHTEMIVRMLLRSEKWGGKNVAVLSRGYKRRLKGFQIVEADGSARDFGDEPLQVKKKFPGITVAVDKNRVEGSRILSDPQSFLQSKKSRKCRTKEFEKADVLVLDDCFQFRALRPDLSVVLVDYNRPTFKDRLLPMGRLRDLPERIAAADALVVSKCPWEMNPWEMDKWALSLGIERYNQKECFGWRCDNGRKQYLFFTKIGYDEALPVFPEGNSRYLYSKTAVMFSGIADDTPFSEQLRLSYKLVGHLKFGDHHKFRKSDISSIRSLADAFPTSLIITTEKDYQRIRDCKKVPDSLRQRMFYMPIRAQFLSEDERSVFAGLINGL